MTATRRPALWLLALLTLAWLLRVYHLGYNEMRGDETFTYFFLQPAPRQIIQQTIALGEPHPLAASLVEKLWLAVGGNSEFSVRFSSAWFNMLAVALLYRLGRRLGLSPARAGLATLLLAINPDTLANGQDGRMYSLLLAMTVASSWLAWEALSRGRGRYWCAYVVVSWLALNSHYLAVFVVLAQNLFVLAWAWRGRRRRLLAAWLAAQLALVLLFAPWFLLVGRSVSGYGGTAESPGLPAMAIRSFSALAGGQTVPPAWRPWLALLAALVLTWSLARLLRGDAAARERGWWLALGLLVPLGGLWLAATWRPVFREHYLVPAVPAFCLLLVAGLPLPALARRAAVLPNPATASSTEAGLRAPGVRAGAARRAWLASGLLAALGVAAATMLASYYAALPYSRSPGWRGLVAEIKGLTAGLPAGRVRIAQNYPDPALWYYYTGPVDHVVLPPVAQDAARTRQEVDGLVDQGVDWVLLPVYASDAWDATGIAAAALAERYLLLADRQVGDWLLQVYVRPDPGQLSRLDAAFANGVTLDRAGVEPAVVTPGGVLVAHLAWSAPAGRVAGTEKVFIHVTGADDRPVAQVDTLLDAGAGAAGKVATYRIDLPAALPAGDYHVLAGIYDPGQAGAPRVPLAGGGDYLTLATVQAVPRR